MCGMEGGVLLRGDVVGVLVRVLLVLAASAVLYGCGQASPPVERQEKQGGVEKAKPKEPKEPLKQATMKREDFSGREAAQANIVFVLTDDQFPGTENAMPRLKNNITSEGLKFTNMISTFPLCCPGRATIQRGQYAHNTRIYGNSLPLGGWEKFERRGEHKSTIATWLNGAGYQTGLFGKYMNNYTDPLIPPGWGPFGKYINYYTAPLIPPGWDRWYAWDGPQEGWASVNDQGNHNPLDRQEADSLVKDKALRFLSHRLDHAAPVFAFVSFGAMHEPYYHAKIDDDKFEGARIPRTGAFNEDDVSDKPSYVRNLPKLSSSDVTELDNTYRNGLRSLMRVDRFIGEASDLLRRKGEMGNTYFIFYTDNGVHFGQHRFEHRKLQAYEEDVNFPLIIRGPGIPHGVANRKLVGNHDIAPTLARMGGANIPAFVDGRSFLELAKDATTPWPRTAILSERKINRWDMLRMKGKVYTRYEKGGKEYYDLAKDPHQVHNALGASDTTYAAPDRATLAYYEQRLDDLYSCRVDGPLTCKEAEDAPLLPQASVP
jgi:N-acetylglucosamine-6-sulfatase